MAEKKGIRLELYTGAANIGGLLVYTARVATEGEASGFLARVREEMRALARSGKCGSLCVAVHQDGEACDHE